MNGVKQYKVTIFGDHYSLMSDEPEERILKVASSLDAMMKEIADKSRLQDGKKIAVLAALKTAGLLNAFESEQEAIINHCQKLSALIDSELISI
jgi:cell division protein ZapA (FtsZ GTPase activity inhibitor)